MIHYHMIKSSFNYTAILDRIISPITPYYRSIIIIVYLRERSLPVIRGMHEHETKDDVASDEENKSKK